MKQNSEKKYLKLILIIFCGVLMTTLNVVNASEAILEHSLDKVEIENSINEQLLRTQARFTRDYDKSQEKLPEKFLQVPSFSNQQVINNSKFSISPRKAQRLIGQYDIYSSDGPTAETLEIVSVNTSVPYSIYFRYNIYFHGILTLYDQVGFIYNGLMFFHIPTTTLMKTYYLSLVFGKGFIEANGVYNVFSSLLECDEMPPLGSYGGKCYTLYPEDVVQNEYYSVTLLKR